MGTLDFMIHDDGSLGGSDFMGVLKKAKEWDATLQAYDPLLKEEPVKSCNFTGSLTRKHRFSKTASSYRERLKLISEWRVVSPQFMSQHPSDQTCDDQPDGARFRDAGNRRNHIRRSSSRPH
jgi:hypothetical protein